MVNVPIFEEFTLFAAEFGIDPKRCVWTYGTFSCNQKCSTMRGSVQNWIFLNLGPPSPLQILLGTPLCDTLKCVAWDFRTKTFTKKAKMPSEMLYRAWFGWKQHFCNNTDHHLISPPETMCIHKISKWLLFRKCSTGLGSAKKFNCLKLKTISLFQTLPVVRLWPRGKASA